MAKNVIRVDNEQFNEILEAKEVYVYNDLKKEIVIEEKKFKILFICQESTIVAETCSFSVNDACTKVSIRVLTVLL